MILPSEARVTGLPSRLSANSLSDPTHVAAVTSRQMSQFVRLTKRSDAMPLYQICFSGPQRALPHRFDV